MRAFRYYDFVMAGRVAILLRSSLIGPAKVVLFNWLMKAVVEIVFLPVTYAVIGFLKRVEGMETFDRGTRYNPFSLADDGEIREYRRP